MDVLYRSAFDIGRDIQSGKCSSVDTLAFFLDRIEQLNPRLNAVVALDTERARKRAREADAAAARGESWGPLHGVPLTIKDAFCTAGLVTTGGDPAKRGFIPETSAIAVERYVAAGAIVFGKSNVPYMSSDHQSYNEIYGVTNNPWNETRTCGGSSGGAAAAVAAGLTPLELGSDIGGSIRNPAHFNGVYGHKPSYGIVPQRGHLPPKERTISAADLSVIGPIGTCVSDLEQALTLIAGPKPEDAMGWQLTLPPPSFTTHSTLRVAVWADDAFCPVDTDIVRCIDAAADTLASLGAAVDRSARPDIDPLANHINYTQLLMATMGAGMPDSVFERAQAAVAAADPTDMSEPLLLSRGLSLSHRRWLKENERRLKFRAAWTAFFTNFDVLLCPCTPATAFPHDHSPDIHARRLLINGQQRNYDDLSRWAGLTLNAYLPATSVPVGSSREGLPIGMQVVAPYLGDRSALAVAALLETHHRAFVAPPGYR